MAVKTPETKEEQDSAYNPGEIQAAEQFGNTTIPAGTDQAEASTNNSANASEELNEAEETPAEIPFTGSGEAKEKQSWKTVLKKRGPTTGIVAIIIGAVVGGGSFFSVALLPLHVLEVFVNHNDSSGRSSSLFYKKLMNYRLGNKAERACKNPSSRACKAVSFGPEEQRRYSQNGFDLRGKEVNGRLVVTSIETPPDENNKRHIVKSNKALERRVAQSTKIRNAYVTSNDARFNSYGNRFRTLMTKFGARFDKTKIKDAKNTKEANKTFRDSANIRSGAAAAEDFQAKKTSSISGKFLKGSNAAGYACLAYNTTRAILAGVKTYHAYEYVKFFIKFASTASQIKEAGIDPDAIDPETSEYLGNILTSYALSGPSKGLTATDSQGYKAAAYGDRGRLETFTSNMLLNGNPLLISLDKTIVDLQNKIGKKNIRATCKTANDPKMIAASIALVCGGQAAAGAAAGTILPGAGTVAGGLGGLVKCIGGQLIATVVGSVAISYIIDKGVGLALDALTNSKITSDLAGTEVGDALALGSNFALTAKAGQSGQYPGTSSEVSSFQAATEQSTNDYIAAETDRAKSTPFDITNQYSFLGSLVRKTGVIDTKMNFSSLLRTLGSVPSSVIPTAKAETMKYTSNGGFDPDNCQTQEQKDMQLSCDVVGSTRSVVSNRSLNVEVDELFDYMESNGQATPNSGDGSPVSGSKYEKWLKYCTEREPGPIGETETAFEDDDYYWANGANCTSANLDNDNGITNEQRDYFVAYKSQDDVVTDAEDVPVETSTESGGSELRIATFNVLGASHNDDPGKSIEPWDERIVKSLDVIKTNNLEVIGFQELEDKQANYLTANLPNYGHSTIGKSSDRIMWNTDRFEKTGEGSWKSTYFGGPEDEPWVKLQDKDTGQEFYVMSLHDPINKEQGSPEVRAENARKHLAKAQELGGDKPVFMVGDFNGGFTKNSGSGAPSDQETAYCILTGSGALNNAYDLSVSRSVKCPNPPESNPGFEIDHIYMTPEVQVEPNSLVATGRGSDVNGSDHPTVYVDAVIPSAQESSTVATNFSMATFNICYGQATDGGLSPCADGVGYQARLKKTAAMLRDKVSVAGLQEVRPNQYSDILKEEYLGSGYDIYPKPYGPGAYPGQNPIIWKKSDFTLVKGESIRGYTVTGGAKDSTNVKVRLRHTSGQEIYVINAHDPANAATNASAQRQASAVARMVTVNELKKEGIPIFLTGDFNSDYSAVPYCTFTSGGVLWDAWDASRPTPLTGRCPSKDKENPGGFDHIYMSTNVNVKKYTKTGRGVGFNGSDHTTVFADIEIPGSDGATTSGELAWPMDKSYFDANRSDWLGSHSSTGSAWGGASADIGVQNDKGAGIASDIGDPPVGTQVRAMLGGEVVSTDLCGSKDGIAIKSRVNGKVIGISYMHGTGQVVSVGDTVKAGDPIMKLGAIGCSVTGAHLHIGIAYGGKYICPQDVFLAMSKDQSVDWDELVGKAGPGCSGRY